MSCNLLLRGGPTHDFDATSDLLAAVFAEQGIPTVMLDEPADFFAALRSGEVDGAPVTAVTVDALRWRMDQHRYATQRDRWAVDPADDDLATVERFVRSGGGMLAVHTAVICFDAHPRWTGLCGAAWNWDRSSHPPPGPVTVEVTECGRTHPVTAGSGGFEVHDELYGDLDLIEGLTPLMVGRVGAVAAPQPVLWAQELDAGRVVTDLLGHGPESLTHPGHRVVLTGAVRWVCRAGAPATHGGGVT